MIDHKDMINSNHFIRRMLLILICISIGTVFYYLYCPDIFFVKVVDTILPVSFHIMFDSDNILVGFLRYYFFDFLWAIALSTTVSFWYLDYNTYRKKGILIIIVLEIVMESLQGVPYIPGTFDVCDILVEFVANVFVILLIKERLL